MEASYGTAYNLGCGNRIWPGWINVDLTGASDLKSDIRALPAIESGTADAVAAIHVLEHFHVWEVPDILLEWRRVLKPGGRLIVELPCMDKVFGYVVGCVNRNEGLETFMTMHALYGDPKHRDPLMCHKWGWFAGPLMKVVGEAGFRDVEHCQPRYHFAFRDMRIEAVK